MTRLDVKVSDKCRQAFAEVVELMKQINASEIVMVFDGHGDSGAYEVWGVKIKNRYWKFGSVEQPDSKLRFIREPVMEGVFEHEEWDGNINCWRKSMKKGTRSLSDLANDLFEFYMKPYGGYYDGTGAFGEVIITANGVTTRINDYRRQPSYWEYKTKTRKKVTERTEVNEYEAPLTPMQVLDSELGS